MRRILPAAIVVGITACDPAFAEPTRPPVVPVPTELAASRPSIARTFDTGMITSRHVHVTHTLRRHGIQAMLTLEVRTARSGTLFEIGPWTAQPVKTFFGTATETKQGVTLTLANIASSGETIALTCKKTRVAAARPTAVRHATIPAGVEECGDEGRWQPRATKSITVLACTPVDDHPEMEDAATFTIAPHLAFAPAPGVEWLFVNDDCLQGGGYRGVPADGSIVNNVR